MSKTPKRDKRERRSRAEIEKLIAAYRESGLTQVAFARKRNLKLGTLRKWLGKERVMRGPVFREVRVPVGPTGEMTIRLPGGIELEVSSGVDCDWVLKVVRGLRK